MMRRRFLIAGILFICLASGCRRTEVTFSQSNQTELEEAEQTDTGEADKSMKYTKEDMDSSFSVNNAGQIKLDELGAAVTGENVTVNDNVVTISDAGTYIVTGSTADTRIEVNLEQAGTVKLVLNNASVTCKENAPINIIKGRVILTLAEATTNYIEDGSSYTNVDDDGNPSAAIFSKDDLTLNGTGSLEVKANFKNAVQSKKTLKVVTGTYKINAVESGFVGRGGAMIRNGNYSIVSSGKNENVITDAPETPPSTDSNTLTNEK